MRSIHNLTLAMLVMLIWTAETFANEKQEQERKCGTMENLERLKKNDTALEAHMQEIENFTQGYLKNNSANHVMSTVNIPVVVHVIYNTSSQNITDAQIQSQIDVLNEDFQRTNADKINTPSVFSNVAANSEITFCLATINPSGAPTTGITRTSTSKISFTSDDAVKYTSSGGKDAWPAGKYLNLWVCNLGGGLLGYAQFPGGASATDGVVINYQYFGRNGSALAPYNKGRTGTHEVGHWLNLRHIWGDASCGNDYVADTPVQQTSNYGCPSFPHSTCSNGSNGDMFMNYMDYTDDACMNMFSLGQKSRMQTLFTSSGARASLLTSNGCGGSSTPSYCASSGSNTGYEYISNVKLNTINNTTPASGGYANYTTISTSLTKGSSYIITLTPGFSSSTYTEYFKVWIDYNNDMVFDASENVYTSSGSASAVSGTFTVPSTAATATTRMRVSMSDGAISGPCASFTYGEVEDYSINLIASTTSSCGTPAGLSATSITSSSATLNWSAVSSASSYNVRYKPTSSTTWINTNSTSTSKSISGLSASTQYEFQVQAVCSSSGNYSASSIFTTTGTTTTSNTVQIGSGTGTTGAVPYGTYYMDERAQFILTQSELAAAGYSSTNSYLRALSFYVTTASSQTMYGFTIKMRHTTATSFSSSSFLSSSGMTTVYSGSYTATTNAWNAHTFSSAFQYNGTDNILIEICWDNSTYTTNSSVQYTTTSSYKTLYYRADVSSGGVCSNTSGTRTYNRPNVRLLFKSSATGKFGEEQHEPSTPIILDLSNGINMNVFPNPVSSQMNVDYKVAEDNSSVLIQLYDMKGILIMSGGNDKMPAGNYTYTVDVNTRTACSNGIYLCTVNVNGQTETKRFMVLK